ncbi:SLAM family member 5 [Bombina bombina]|uniref:SLAM family member 5 n=1 Tax=Bombina bombina TaxID=8345 RepID=UPI00235A8826|nr:SLAM family member 5 [Bombina bombina]
MLLFLFWIPLIVLLPKDISCKTLCGDTIIVNGTEKEDVILQVDKSINIQNIVWTAGEEYLAKTSANGQIDIQRNKLKKKLQSEQDASLKFLFVTDEDQRTYTANILLSDETTCIQRFDLRVYKKLSTEDIMINISKHITNDTCNINLTCSVNRSNVSVTWSSSNNTRKYEATIFLHIRNVVNENDTCTAENPVSKASRTVSPREYCDKGAYKHSRLSSNMHWGILVSVCLIFIIIIIITIIVFIFMHRKRKKKPEVGIKSQDTEHAYELNTENFEKPSTVYSMVEHTKLHKGKEEPNPQGPFTRMN